MKLKALKEYIKDLPEFLLYLVRDYPKERRQMIYDRKTSFTAFPGEYEKEIKRLRR